jgi:hypothetical protein
LLQRLQERSGVGLRARIVRAVAVAAALKHSDAPHALGLLRADGERPRGSRTAEKRDELAPPHCPPRCSDKHGIELHQRERIKSPLNSS